MKNIKILAAVLGVAISVASCKDYLDVNDNPNAVPIENVTPKHMFPGAVSQIWRTQGTTFFQFGNLMMNNWGANIYSFGAAFIPEFTLASVNSSFYNTFWDSLYLNMNNFVSVEQFNNNNQDGKNGNYVAMAKVMKAFYMQYIVDLYGDAPYSQAFLGAANMTPGYDNDEDIYKALYAELDAAQALINNPSPNAEAVNAASDIVFGGDMESWKKFANNIKLKLVMRMSEIPSGAAMATFRDQKISELSLLSEADYYLSDVKENPGYSSANDSKMNPLFLTYRANSIGTAPQNFSSITVSEHMANALNGNVDSAPEPQYSKFNSIVDPRRFQMWTPVLGKVKGTKQGTLLGQPGVPANSTISRFANGLFVGSGTLSVANGASRPGMIMSAAETYFLLAEASVRYPSVYASGKAAFENGIKKSCAWIGLSETAATVTTYLNSINSVSGLGWDASAAVPNKIEAIMTQKWIALASTNPTEMFIEYNRTGMPWTPLAVNSVQSRKPYRLMYPNSEYVANSGNVPNMQSSQCFTINEKTPFWIQH